MLANETKKCGHCNEELPLSAFGKWAYGADGLKTECKSCMHRYYHKNVDYQEQTKKSALERYRLSKLDPILKKQIRESQRKTMIKFYYNNKTECLLSQRSYRERIKQGIQEMIWSRSSGYCENCHKPLLKQRGTYAVHHIDRNKLNNKSDNLLLLCVPCHLHIVHNKS